MISRVADAIYWLSRYLERAENIARFIDVNLRLILDLEFENTNSQWAPIVITSGDDKDFNARYSASTEENVIYFLTFDDDNPNSIHSCVRNARENARSIRDTISSEMWEQINRYYLLIEKNRRKRNVDDLQSFFYEVKMANHLFVGLANTTMSHNEAWHFSRMGRLLERADKTVRMMDVKYFNLLPSHETVNSSYDIVQWGALLKSLSAFEMYRKRYHTINYNDIADFLIYDEEFPRSLSYCFHNAYLSVKKICEYTKTPCKALTEVKQLNTYLHTTNIDEISRKGLHEFIDMIQFNMNIVDNEIYHSFIDIKQMA